MGASSSSSTVAAGLGVEAMLLRGVPQHDDRPRQASSFVVSGRGAVLVVTRLIETETALPFGLFGNQMNLLSPLHGKRAQ